MRNKRQKTAALKDPIILRIPKCKSGGLGAVADSKTPLKTKDPSAYAE